jgi:hypothetical protein
MSSINKNLAETLELHLTEIKQQEESKLRHPKPPTHKKLLHITLKKQEGSCTTRTGSNPAWETSGRPTGEHQASCGIPTDTPVINQHSPLDRPTPLSHKKNP